jgi:hypothetical protein
MASLTLFSTSEALELRIILELLRVIGRFLTGRAELKEARVKRREDEKAFRSGFVGGVWASPLSFFCTCMWCQPHPAR